MAAIIILGNNAKIINEPDIAFLSKLDKHLSFYVMGAEHTRAFKGYVSNGKFIRWDGYKKLLNNNLTFSTGLVENVKQFYISNSKEIEIIDKRPTKSIGTPQDITNNLKKIGIVPYNYQQEAASVIDGYERGIIKLATGGGKSLIAALIAARIGKKTIIYVVGKDILYQFYKLFSEAFNEEIGIIGDGNCIIKNINIASVWTVGQAIGMKKAEILLDENEPEKELNKNKYSEILKLMKEAKLAIFDECHMCACDTIQKIYKYSSLEHIYGLSGSPARDDGSDLLGESILGKYIVNISASYLIDRDYLARPEIRFVSVPHMECERNYKQVYKEYIVENYIRNDLIKKYAKILTDKGYKTLILFSSIRHGKILYELISPNIKCAILDGSDDQDTRDAVKKQIENGEINCILASKIFDQGVDIPCLSGLIIACAGKSSIRALQRVGRVIRKFENKKYAAIVDFADDTVFLKKHSEIRYKTYLSEDGFDVQWPNKKRNERRFYY